MVTLDVKLLKSNLFWLFNNDFLNLSRNKDSKISKMKRHNPILSITILATFMWMVTCGQSAQSQDYNSTDIEKMDTCLLGITLKSAIEKLKIDTSQFYAFDEPPLILRGVKINLADTCEIELYVERTSIIDKPSIGFRQEYKYIEHKKVIGLFWTKKRKDKQRSIYL